MRTVRRARGANDLATLRATRKRAAPASGHRAVAYPQATASMLLWWPVGGAKYRIKAHQRFAEHLAFVRERGLSGVVEHVRKEGKAFNADARGGPWASVIKNDAAFAASYAKR